MTAKKPIPLELIRIVVPLLIIAAGVWGFRVFGKAPEVPSKSNSSEAVVSVETQVAKTFGGEFQIETDGVSIPYREVTVTAEVAGRITKKTLSCRAGSFVKTDALLVQIDPTDYKIEITRLEAQLEQAREELAAADVDITNDTQLLELSKEELKLQQRQLARVEDGANKKALTDNELDDQRRAELSARNALQVIRNQLTSLAQKKKSLTAAKELVEAQLARAQVDLARTTVKSPLTGTVIADLVEENEYVKKGDPLLHINDTNRMEVKCHLKVDELYWILLQSGVLTAGNEPSGETRFEIPATPAQVVFQFDGAEFIWSGTLSRYEGTGIDEQTRTIPCRVLVYEPTKVQRVTSGRMEFLSLPTLFTGLFVRVRIPVKPNISLVQIPDAALRPGGKVWCIRDDKLQVVDVNVARSTSGGTLVRQIDGGLQPGDHVVTSPISAVVDGMSVKEIAQP